MTTDQMHKIAEEYHKNYISNSIKASFRESGTLSHDKNEVLNAIE